MKIYLLVLSLFFTFATSLVNAQDLNQEKLEIDFKILAKTFDELKLEVLPLKDRGRLKPLDTLSRESNLFLTGKKALYGLTPVSFYLALNLFKDSSLLNVINVRSPELRVELKLDKNSRLFSLSEIEATSINVLAQTAMEVEKKNKNLLSPIQSSALEVMNQTWLLKSIQSNEGLTEGLNFSLEGSSNFIMPALQNLFMAITSGEKPEVIKNWAQELIKTTMSVKVDENFSHQRDRMFLEVMYNKATLFFWAGLIYFLIAVLSFLPFTQKLFDGNAMSFALVFPLLLLAIGFGIRIYITEFPPVTNMYGTMVWVSFGISLFSYVLYLIYRDKNILGIMALGSALLLILTENIPLIISPSMDPIVAVLRSSYWLTIHVLTVTISYAAFSMSMLLGNIYFIRSMFFKMDNDVVKRFSHYAYRSIQLGVFLLTTGIILGGVWADYSWGRFWGWDPKETWALIADLGFLAILHGRFAGWISPVKILIYSPVAYLLVIMAWFGVNFILATGLHSYGFSSGGTFMVIAFLISQLIIFGLYFTRSMFYAKE